MPGKLKWAPFGPTCIKLYDLKLGIIRGIISEHAVAMGTVKNAFKLVTQLVDQRRSLSWLSHCKREKVPPPISPPPTHPPPRLLLCYSRRAREDRRKSALNKWRGCSLMHYCLWGETMCWLSAENVQMWSITIVNEGYI